MGAPNRSVASWFPWWLFQCPSNTDIQMRINTTQHPRALWSLWWAQSRSQQVGDRWKGPLQRGFRFDVNVNKAAWHSLSSWFLLFPADNYFLRAVLGSEQKQEKGIAICYRSPPSTSPASRYQHAPPERRFCYKRWACADIAGTQSPFCGLDKGIWQVAIIIVHCNVFSLPW